MNNSFFNGFEQKLYTYYCEKEILNDVIEYFEKVGWGKIKNRNVKNFWKAQGKSYIKGKRGLLSVSSLNSLHEWFESCIEDALEKIDWDKNHFNKLKITQSWLNISEKGEAHHIHNHSLSILSGVLHLTEPSSIEFLIPSIYRLNEFLGSEKNSNKTIKQSVKGEKGKLIIFPSSLFHYVNPNTEDAPRKSVSFNTWVSEGIGKANEAAFIPKN